MRRKKKEKKTNMQSASDFVVVWLQRSEYGKRNSRQIKNQFRRGKKNVTSKRFSNWQIFEEKKSHTVQQIVCEKLYKNNIILATMSFSLIFFPFIVQ